MEFASSTPEAGQKLTGSPVKLEVAPTQIHVVLPCNIEYTRNILVNDMQMLGTFRYLALGDDLPYVLPSK